MQAFGELIKSLRVAREITLREFCRKAGLDASNWSKVERGVLAPPKGKDVLNTISHVLDLSQEEQQGLQDTAFYAFIPKDLLPEEEVLKKLPLFFRTVRGEKPTDEELDKLIKLIKEG